MKLNVLSLNVLHIIHELNHAFNSSPVLDKYGIGRDTGNESTRLESVRLESTRLKDLVNLISSRLSEHTIMCLQEVPGDLLNLLSEESIHHTVYSHRYSRQPKLKNQRIPNPYIDSFEYLVTMIPNALVTGLDSSFIGFSDFGKGGLVVEINAGIRIINVHMTPGSIGDTRDKIMNLIDQSLESYPGKYLMIGDFNSDHLELKNDLKNNMKRLSDSTIHPIKGDTRKGLSNGIVRFSKLDHLVTSRDIPICKTFVEDTNDLSDHMMIGCIMMI